MTIETHRSLIEALFWRNRLVLGGLGLTCAAVFSAFYILLDLRADDAEALSLAGRQRMLVQQMDSAALKASHAATPDQRTEALTALRQAANSLRQTRDSIVGGQGPFHGLLSDASREILREFPHELERRLAGHLAIAERATDDGAAPPVRIDPQLVARLGQSAAPLMAALEALVAQLAADSRDRIDAITGLAGVAFATALGLLILSQTSVFRPLSKRLRASTQEADLLRHAIEQSAAAVMVTDPDGIIRYVNPALCRTTGYQPAEMIGRTPFLFKPEATSPDLYHAIWQAVSAGHGWSGELLNRRKDGSQYWELVAISPLRDPRGTITHFVVIGDDITERKERERDLDEARFAAEHASRAKSQFLADMSHELRTPLNAIIGFSDVARREVFGPLSNAKYADYVESIHRSGEHLLAVINDILDLSAIEAGKLELKEEPMCLAPLVNECLAFVRPMAEHGGIRLRAEVPVDLPDLLADPRRVKQILINLLSNAVKFTPEDGEVRVDAALANGKGLRIDVRDSGIGMRPEDIAKALQPFGRVSNQLTRKYEGTGLGLPLTKNLIEHHGGSLSIISVPNAGTTVSIHFPAIRIGCPPPQRAIA